MTSWTILPTRNERRGKKTVELLLALSPFSPPRTLFFKVRIPSFFFFFSSHSLLSLLPTSFKTHLRTTFLWTSY